MKTAIRYPIIIIILLTSFTSAAQESLGLKTERFSGVNSLYINPANTISSPFEWDVNIAGVGLFVENNYLYARNSNIINAIRKRENYSTRTGHEPLKDFPEGELIFDFFNDESEYFAFANAHILGPSVSWKADEFNSFGIFTGIRVHGSARNIPSSFYYKDFKSIRISEGINLDPLEVTAASWGELGVNYSHNLNATDHHQFAVGGNVKLLFPFEAGYIKNNSAIKIQKDPEEIYQFTGVDMEYGLTTVAGNQAENYSLTRNGMGMAMDIGMTYTHEKRVGYHWRIGAALLDVGRMSFYKNTEKHIIETGSIVKFLEEDFENPGDLDDLTEMISTKSLENPNLSKTTNQFSLWMPMALSLSFDYHLKKNYYVHAGMVGRIPLPGLALERTNTFFLIPRYESRWFGFSLPIVLPEKNSLRLGTSLRVGFLTIGTDNIGNYIGKKDLTGGDFYLAVKFNPFTWNGSFDRRTVKKGRVKCYQF